VLCSGVVFALAYPETYQVRIIRKLEWNFGKMRFLRNGNEFLGQGHHVTSFQADGVVEGSHGTVCESYGTVLEMSRKLIVLKWDKLDIGPV